MKVHRFICNNCGNPNSPCELNAKHLESEIDHPTLCPFEGSAKWVKMGVDSE